MKRKPTAVPETVVPKEVLDRVQEACDTAAPKRVSKCVVCGSPSTTSSPENLCWVCRRLKISAWREGEQQMPAQE